MDGDRDELATQATPQSPDTQSCVSELESEWLKLRSEFLTLSPEKFAAVPTTLPPVVQLADMHTAAIDDSFSTSVPSYLCSSPESVTAFKKSTVRYVTFLHEAAASRHIYSPENEFMLVTAKEIVVFALPPYGEGRSFVEKIRLVDDSPTEKLMVARFLLIPSGSPRIVAGGRDGIVKVISPTPPESRYSLMGHRHSIRDLCPMDDCDFLLSCSDDLSIRLWNIRTRVQVVVFQGIIAHTDAIVSLDLHYSQTKFVSAGADRCIQIWNFDEKVVTAKALSKLWNTEFSRVYNVRCNRKHFETRLITEPAFFTFKVHSAKVSLVRFYHDLLVSQDKTNRVCVWQPNPNRGICSFILVHSLDPPMNVRTSFALNTATGLLACAGDSGELLLWNLLSLSAAPTVLRKSFQPTIKGLSFSSDGSILLARCKDGFLLRFDIWS